MANAAAVEIALGLSGVSEVTRGLGTVESGIGRLGGLGGNVGGALLGGVGALATGIGIVGTAAAGAGVALTGFVVGPAMDFQKEISAIGAVAGLTGPALDAVSALALQLGKDTAFSASEAAQGIEELVKGGVSIPDIMNGGAAAMLNLAAAGGVALPAAAEISANAMSMFGLHGSDMAHVADLIAGAANASTISVTDFQYSLQQSGAMAALTGQSFDSLATTIALLGAKGMKGQDAGTSIKSFLGALTPSTKQAKEALKSLGLYTYGPGVVDPASQAAAQKADAAFEQQQQQRATRLASLQQDLLDMQAQKKIDPTALRHKQEQIAALQTEMATATSKAGAVKMTASGGKSAFVDEQGNFLDMVQIIDKLHKATDGLSESQKSATLEAIFGSDAIRVAAILADEGADGYNAMAAAMGNVTAADVAGKRLDNLAGDLEQLKGSAETARIAIGLQLLPVFRQLAQGATGLINGALPKIDQFFKSFKAALGGDMGTDLGSRVALGFILIRDTVTNRVLPALRTLWATLSGAAGGDPLGIILGIAGAVETVGRWFQLGVDAVVTFRQALAGVWTLNGGGNDFVNMVGRIGLAFRDLKGAFDAGGWSAFFGTLWTGYVQPALGNLWTGITTWITTNGPGILATLGTWGAQFAAWAGDVWTTHLWPGLVALWTQFDQWIGAQSPLIIAKLAEWGAAFGTWAITAGGEVGQKLWDAISGKTAAPLTPLALGTVGDMNGVIPQTQNSGIAGFLDTLNTSIQVWGATTGHQAMTDAIHALFIGQGTDPNDQGGIANLLNSWNTAISTWAATTGHAAIVAAFASLGQTARDAFFSDMPDWLKKWLNVDTGGVAGNTGGSSAFGGDAPTPGGGSGSGGAGSVGGGGGAGLFTAYGFKFGTQGGGGATINYSPTYVINGMTYEQGAQIMARESYNELARLLNEDSTYPSGGTSTPATGTVY